MKVVDGFKTFGHLLKGVNITMDRYYISIPFAKQLLQKNITILGTLKANRKARPPAMKENKDRDGNSWPSCKSNSLQLNSYVAKVKSSNLRNVLLLHTRNETYFVTADEKMKPMVCKIYGYVKGGIDIPDRRMQSYTTKSKTRKWTRVSNYYLLDKDRVNAQTIAIANCKVVFVLVGICA